MGSYIDLRNEWNRLMGEATVLANIAREATEKQVAIVRELNVLTTKICNSREEFRSEVHAEIEANHGKPTTRKIVIEDVPPVGPGTAMGRYMPVGTGRPMKANPLPEGLEPVYVAAASGAKRKCSLCRNLDPTTKLPVKGHRSQNCPFAHVIQNQKKEAAAQPKQKKERKPLSPERKAQLAKTLEKARAARKGKK